MTELPSGTVTFLFTDLEGSTRLWEEHPEAMKVALARHDAILRDSVAEHDGHVVKMTGDGIHAVFATAHSALDAAVVMQRGLAVESFGETGPLGVRMGVHTCEADYRDGDYFGGEVNRAARLMSVAHGGQIVVSLVTSGLVRGGQVELVDLGEHRLRDLANAERVFQVLAPGLEREFPRLRSVDAFPGNLPVQVSSFVGRDVELARVADALAESRVVTLTGVGGVGKTRLALRAAAEVVSEFPDGAWLCEFAPVTDPDAVWETLAASLRIQPFPGRSLEESLLEYLAAKRLLLVLDNCEHLLEAVTRQVDVIVRRCPRVAVLATSREGLALDGERMVAVPSLGIPADDADVDAVVRADAVRLFWDRASAAKHDFVLTERNAAAVGVLCRRLDGIPLAIELAAARVRSLAPEDLVARLDQRFKLLTRGSRAALERHQTLRSTIDWSYDLLDPVERSALNRASVFAGGWDLQAAEAVLAGDDLDIVDVADVLGQLVDKSLVDVDVDDEGGVRYRLLETIRQYAQERLQASGETTVVRRRHADYYVELAEAAGPHLRSREMLAWARIIVRDTDNFRAALDWAVEAPSPQHALRLVAPLAAQGRTGEIAVEWAATASTIPGAQDHPLFAEVAAWATWGATMSGDFERAEEFIAAAERAQATLGTPHPSVAWNRALLAFFRNDFEQSRHHAEQWVELGRAADDPYELANALVLLNIVLVATNTLEAATAAADEAVRVARAAGIDTALSLGLTRLALMLPIEDSERALDLCDEAIEVATRIGDHMTVASANDDKAVIAGRRGDWHTALRASVDAAEQYLQIGALTTVFEPLYWAGVALCGLGYFEPAAVLIGTADAMAPEHPGPGWALPETAATNAALIEALGEQHVATLGATGAALEITDAVAYLRAEADRALTPP